LDNINYSASGYHKSLHYWENNTVIQTSDPDEFNTYIIPRTIYSIQLFQNSGEIYREDLFPDMFINGAFNIMPNELLSLQIQSQSLISKWPSEWENDVQPASGSADHMVFNGNADYIRTMRIPAPASLLLVAIGLLSLRYTRSLRM